ncbi:MAG: CCA tRNA nucleotidyltransferase, partial [Bdellovibrionota bacterium]
STARVSKSIRTERPFPLPVYVKEALQRLDEAGYVAYVVGGSVRDFLLGREVKDHDIATSANPDVICKLFKNSITVGKAFGVIKVPVGKEGTLLEIATFRQDLEYQDGRHPKGVVFSGPDEDAVRRDFTINALYYDHKTSRILDWTTGIEDLKSKTLRAIGDPDERFREDALRLLRAVRFTTRLEFNLDPATADAVKKRARLITRVSPERIRDELTMMWKGPNPARSLELLSRLDLLIQILPEVEKLKGLPQSPIYLKEGDVWTHTLRRLELLAKLSPARSATLAWATVLHEIGKPEAARHSGRTNFNGFEVDGARMAAEIAERLKMSRSEIDCIRTLISEQLKFREVFSMREATLQRFLRQEYFEEMLALHRVEAIASDGNLAAYEFCASRLAALKSEHGTPKLIDGKDLIQLGFRPGPEFSEILRVVEDMTLERKLGSKEEALEYVVRHFVK